MFQPFSALIEIYITYSLKFKIPLFKRVKRGKSSFGSKLLILHSRNNSLQYYGFLENASIANDSTTHKISLNWSKPLRNPLTNAVKFSVISLKCPEADPISVAN